MFIISRKLFMLFLLLVSLAIAAPVVYLILQFDSPDLDRKAFIEGAVFLLVLLELVILSGALVLGGTFRRSRLRAERLMGGKAPESVTRAEWQSVLGDLGDSFYSMNENLFKISKERRIKIDGLYRLCLFVVQNFESPAFVTNIFGEVILASQAYGEKTNRSRSSVVGNRFSQLHPGINLQPLVSELRRNHLPQELKTDNGQLTVYPISDSRGEIVYLLFSLSSKSFRLDFENGTSNIKEQPEKTAISLKERIRQGIWGWKS